MWLKNYYLFVKKGDENLISRLDKQIKFLEEIDKLKSVIRENYIINGERFENVAEHSWHLSLFVIVLTEYFENLNVIKALKMALIHDLVEIYAGDTFAFDINQNKEDEKVAAEKLFSTLPDDQYYELINLWKEFEEQKSIESVCVTIIDRLQPLVLITNYS